MPETPCANTMPAPSVGRVVHFMYGDRHLPAIITDPAFIAPDESVLQALTVFLVGAPPFTTYATLDPSAAPATWHWPEHVPPMTPPFVPASLPGPLPTPTDPRLPLPTPESDT